MKTLDDDRLPFVLRYPEEYTFQSVSHRGRPCLKFRQIISENGTKYDEVVFNLMWDRVRLRRVPSSVWIAWRLIRAAPLSTPCGSSDLFIATARAIFRPFWPHAVAVFLYDGTEYRFTIRQRDTDTFYGFIQESLTFRQPVSHANE